MKQHRQNIERLQLALSKLPGVIHGNFSAEADLNAVPLNNVLRDSITAYPRFPLPNENPTVTPQELSSEEAALLSHLSVDERKVNTIEATPREQSESEIWKKDCT